MQDVKAYTPKLKSRKAALYRSFENQRSKNGIWDMSPAVRFYLWESLAWNETTHEINAPVLSFDEHNHRFMTVFHVQSVRERSQITQY